MHKIFTGPTEEQDKKIQQQEAVEIAFMAWMEKEQREGRYSQKKADTFYKKLKGE